MKLRLANEPSMFFEHVQNKCFVCKQIHLMKTVLQRKNWADLDVDQVVFGKLLILYVKSASRITNVPLTSMFLKHLYLSCSYMKHLYPNSWYIKVVYVTMHLEAHMLKSCSIYLTENQSVKNNENVYAKIFMYKEKHFYLQRTG